MPHSRVTARDATLSGMLISLQGPGLAGVSTYASRLGWPAEDMVWGGVGATFDRLGPRPVEWRGRSFEADLGYRGPLYSPALLGSTKWEEWFSKSSGWRHFHATKRDVLAQARGVLFVVDSQPARLTAALEALEALRRNLLWVGRSLEDVELVFALNKTDLPGLPPAPQLRSSLGWPGADYFSTSALSGAGVEESFERLLARIPESS